MAATWYKKYVTVFMNHWPRRPKKGQDPEALTLRMTWDKLSAVYQVLFSCDNLSG